MLPNSSVRRVGRSYFATVARCFRGRRWQALLVLVLLLLALNVLSSFDAPPHEEVLSTRRGTHIDPPRHLVQVPEDEDRVKDTGPAVSSVVRLVDAVRWNRWSPPTPVIRNDVTVLDGNFRPGHLHSSWSLRGHKRYGNGLLLPGVNAPPLSLVDASYKVVVTTAFEPDTHCSWHPGDFLDSFDVETAGTDETDADIAAAIQTRRLDQFEVSSVSVPLVTSDAREFLRSHIFGQRTAQETQTALRRLVSTAPAESADHLRPPLLASARVKWSAHDARVAFAEQALLQVDMTTTQIKQRIPVVVLSMHGSPRRETIAAQLRRAGLVFSFVDAIVPPAGQTQQYFRRWAHQRDCCWPQCWSKAAQLNKPGDLGCLLTHMETMRIIAKNRWPLTLVLEDDAIPREDVDFTQVDWEALAVGDWTSIFTASDPVVQKDSSCSWGTVAQLVRYDMAARVWRRRDWVMSQGHAIDNMVWLGHLSYFGTHRVPHCERSDLAAAKSMALFYHDDDAVSDREKLNKG